MSNALKDMHQPGILPGPVSPPIEIMKKHAMMLLQRRDELLGIQTYSEPMQRLRMAIELWGHPEAVARLTNMQLAPPAPMPKKSHVLRTPDHQNASVKALQTQAAHPMVAN